MRTENQWFFFGKEDNQILTNPYGIDNTMDSLREFMETPEKSSYRSLATIKNVYLGSEIDDDVLLASINKLVKAFYEAHTDEDGEFVSDATNQLLIDGEVYYLDGAEFFYGVYAVGNSDFMTEYWSITNDDGLDIVFDGTNWLIGNRD